MTNSQQISRNIIILIKLITGISFVWSANGYLIINFIQWTANAAYYFYPMSFFIERSISLLWEKNYETFYSLWLLLTLSFFPIIIAIYISIHVLFLYFWIPVTYMYNASNSFLIICWTGYLIIFLITKKYSKQVISQTLSEKFQRYENLKTNKTMFWFAIVSWISVILGTVYIQLFTHYKAIFPQLSEINMDAISRVILDTIQAFIFLILPISFIFTHTKLKTKYLKFCKCFKSKNKVSNTSTTITATHSLPFIESVMGKNLNIYGNGQDHYFQMLASDWNEKFKNCK